MERDEVIMMWNLNKRVAEWRLLQVSLKCYVYLSLVTVALIPKWEAAKMCHSRTRRNRRNAHRMRAGRSREWQADSDPPLAQYTLLYAVLFCDLQRRWTRFRSQEQLVWASSIQCTVTINNFEKSYVPPCPSTETSPLLYPTNTFSSPWNCVLDLAAH